MSRPLERGHLVAHRTLERLGEGVVQAIEPDHDGQGRERSVRVDFGREGTWSVPVEELALVWQPPSVKASRTRKDWLRAKRRQEREARRGAKQLGDAAASSQQSRREQHRASLTPWRDEAAWAAATAKPKRKKKRKKKLAEPEPEPEPEPKTAEQEWQDVSVARDRLAAARAAARDLRAVVEASPSRAAESGEAEALQQAEAECAALEASLRDELQEAEEAQKEVDEIEAAKAGVAPPPPPPPKTLPELAFLVLQEQQINLLDGFRRFDTNGDGVINAEELQSGFEQLTQVRLPTPRVSQLITQLEGEDGDGVISYSEFCERTPRCPGLDILLRHRLLTPGRFGGAGTFFKQLAHAHEEKQHRAKFLSLFRNGEWPPWDGMTDAAHVACAHFGHSRDRWPPGKAETSAAEEAEEEAKEQEEARKAAEAEVERLGTPQDHC